MEAKAWTVSGAHSLVDALTSWRQNRSQTALCIVDPASQRPLSLATETDILAFLAEKLKN